MNHWQSSYQQALAHCQTGQWSQAEVLLRQVIQVERSSSVLSNYGVVLTQLGQYQSALVYYNEALSLEPYNKETLSNRIEALLCLQDKEGVEHACQHLLSLHPEDAVLHARYAQILMQWNRYDESLSHFQRAVALNPGQIDYQHYQVHVLARLSRIPTAIALCRQILQAHPKHAKIWDTCGRLLQEQGSLDEALSCYQEALTHQTNYAPALHNRVTLLEKMGYIEEALLACQEGIIQAPNLLALHRRRAFLLQSLGRNKEALEAVHASLSQHPNDSELHNRIGGILIEQKDYPNALVYHQRAVALNPSDPSSHYQCGYVLQLMGRHADSIPYYQASLHHQPDYAPAANNWGQALMEQRQYAQALPHFDAVLRLQPNNAVAWNNRGSALQYMGKLPESIDCYRIALGHSPNYYQAICNWGQALVHLMRLDEAKSYFERALAINPLHGTSHWNLALLKLQSGNFAEGWEEYEWRWKMNAAACVPRTYPMPPWDGKSSLQGKVILLYTEQGFGDTLQFCRYVPLIKALGATVVLEVPPVLFSLMKTLHGVDGLLVSGQEVINGLDTHCPLLSLPRVLGTRLENIPSPIPYLQPPSVNLAHWAQRIKEWGYPRIGLVVSGSRLNIHDATRSIPLDLALQYFSMPLVLLHTDISPTEQSLLQQYPWVHACPSEIQDFADTAGIIAHLEVLISVDTAPAHLAGAMGKPVWIMLAFYSEWRWLLDRTDSPWYPSARLFRQGEDMRWEPVLREINTTLQNYPETSAKILQ